MLNPYLITLIVFMALAGMSLLIFNILFIFHRLNLNNEYKLKVKYDFYKNNPIGSNLKSIETLVSKNSELQPILDYLIKCNLIYNNQLEILHIQLQNVGDELKTLRIWSSRKKINQIKNNFIVLDKHQNEFKKFNLDTQKYANNASHLATDLYALIANLTAFNKDNLFSILHPEITRTSDIDKDVYNISMQINRELNYINYATLHNLFIKEIFKIKELYEISYNLFNIDKYLFAYDALIELVINLNKKSKLNNEQKIIIAKKIAQSRSHVEQINVLLKQSEFAKATNIYTREVKLLEDLLLSLKVDELYLQIYNKNFDDFKNNITSFYNLIVKNKIKDLYKEILNSFTKDKTITDLIHKNIDLINAIYKEIDDFNALLNTPDFYNKINYAVKYIFKIYQLMLKFKSENDQLLNMIEKKHKNFLEIMIKLHDIELKLSDLERMYDDYNIVNEQLAKNIFENRAAIQEIRDSIVELTNGPMQIVDARINSIEEMIQSSLEIIKVNMNLNIMVKRLRLYSNRYANVTTKQQLNNFNQLYKQHKYYELIEAYIDFIQKMKKQKRVD